MAYTVNDKGFAKWMVDNLPESLFSEYYKVYQNEIKTELIRNNKIWYGDGIEEITPTMLNDLKALLATEMDSLSILKFTVISYMELFLNQYANHSNEPADPVKPHQYDININNKNKSMEEPVSATVIKPNLPDSVVKPIPDIRHEPLIYIAEKSKDTKEKEPEKSNPVKNILHRNAKGTSEENVDGAALHKDLSFTDYKFTQPDSFTYKGETYRSKTFSDLYIQTLELLIRDYPDKMVDLPEKYVWFRYEPFGTTTSKQLSNGIYAGTNYHRYDYAKFLQKIFDNLGLPRDTMFIDSHRDYQGHSYSQKRIGSSLKTEKVVLHLNEDWRYKIPLSYTLRRKQTIVKSQKWIDLYISVLEYLIQIDPYRMKNLPSLDEKFFSYTDFSSSIRFRVLSNGVRVSGFTAKQIEEMLERLFSYLGIAPADFEIQAIKEAE